MFNTIFGNMFKLYKGVIIVICYCYIFSYSTIRNNSLFPCAKLVWEIVGGHHLGFDYFDQK